MLHHPRDDRVIDGDVLVNPGLQAKFQCTKQAADHPHPYLCPAVGLGVVGSRVLLGQLVELLALHSRQFHGPSHQCLDRCFAVGLEDDARVAEPQDVLHHDVGDDAVLVRTLAWDDMAEHCLGRVAPDHKALNQLAAGPCFFQSLIALRVDRVLELLALLHAAAGDEEIIEPDDRYAGPVGLPVLKSTAASEHTPFAPQPVWQVGYPVLPYLPHGRTSRIARFRYGLDLGLLLLLNFNVLTPPRCPPRLEPPELRPPHRCKLWWIHNVHTVLQVVAHGPGSPCLCLLTLPSKTRHLHVSDVQVA